MYEDKTMISVFAVMTAKVGQKQEALKISRANLETVRAEAGCHEYRLVDDVSNAGSFQKKLGEHSFAFIEQWESMAALEAHLATPHMQAFAEKTKDLLDDSAIFVMQSAD